jgi:hypothetical protein
MVRQEFVATAEMRKRFLVSPKLIEQGSGSVERILMTWVELNGLAEYLKGVVVAPLYLECGAEIDEVIRPGAEPDSARHPFHGVVMLPAVQRYQAHEMQRLGVIGFRIQHLPAAKLGIEILSGAEVTQAHLIEGSRYARF